MTQHTGIGIPTSGNDIFYGNSFDFGPSPNPSLVGGLDDLPDTINGLGGNDILFGDLFNQTNGYEADDIFGGDGNDWIFGDTVSFSYAPLLAAFPGLQAIVITLEDGSVLNITSDAAWQTRVLTGANDFLNGGAGDDHIFGSGGADILRGDAGNDYLDGGTGQDDMNGGTGNDFYFVENTFDIVSELNGSGTDTVYTSISFSLDTFVSSNIFLAENIVATGSLNTILTGNLLNNSLNGSISAAANSLRGLGGNDVYVVGAGDTIVEVVGAVGGIDTVSSSLLSLNLAGFANVENISLTGSLALIATGNALANTINGAGNTAANSLRGLGGNDVYVVGAGDTIVEVAGAAGGIDTVSSSLVSLNLAAFANVENISLTGSLALIATGNALANTINGAGNAAANSLRGLGGNDFYVVGAGDTIVEVAGAAGGIDTASSGVVSLNLAGFANVEYIRLAGSIALNATGNSTANAIYGNTASNILNGMAGNDILTGGLGNDFFVFNTAPSAANRDTITDFSVVSDTIRLENGVFSGLIGTNTLSLAQFYSSTSAVAAHDLDDRIIYNSTTGALYYDADGNLAGGVAAVQFATLNGSPDTLTNLDFQII